MSKLTKEYREPRTLYSLRWNASGVIWPDDPVTVTEFRERLQFFALNAGDTELKALAEMVQL